VQVQTGFPVLFYWKTNVYLRKQLLFYGMLMALGLRVQRCGWLLSANSSHPPQRRDGLLQTIADV